MAEALDRLTAVCLKRAERHPQRYEGPVPGHSGKQRDHIFDGPAYLAGHLSLLRGRFGEAAIDTKICAKPVSKKEGNRTVDSPRY